MKVDLDKMECIFFDSQEDISALVQELQQSGDLGYAISILGSYFNGLSVGP